MLSRNARICVMINVTSSETKILCVIHDASYFLLFISKVRFHVLFEVI